MRAIFKEFTYLFTRGGESVIGKEGEKSWGVE